MQNTPHMEPIPIQHILEQPIVCAECGLQMTSRQVADECELCGAPRCRACATAAGDQTGTKLSGGYVCSTCATAD